MSAGRQLQNAIRRLARGLSHESSAGAGGVRANVAARSNIVIAGPGDGTTTSARLASSRQDVSIRQRDGRAVEETVITESASEGGRGDRD